MGESKIVRRGGGVAESIVFTNATGGTILEYDLDGKRYRSHTFTSNDDFVVTQVGSEIGERNRVDYLVIAGGGSGGSGDVNPNRGGGGGGAGGYRTSIDTTSNIKITEQSYEIVIGAGGPAVTSNMQIGASGSTSSALGIFAVGGGGGASRNSSGLSGGSGGGAGGNSSNGTGTFEQGFNGGGRPGFSNCGAGGGGAGQNGTNITANGQGTKGGDGLANLIRTGSNETRAGGGGGGGSSSSGGGGAGGGGAGNRTGFATSGSVNTGSGGGGIGSSTATTGAGGSGIVIIRYEIAPN